MHGGWICFFKISKQDFTFIREMIVPLILLDFVFALVFNTKEIFFKILFSWPKLLLSVIILAIIPIFIIARNHVLLRWKIIWVAKHCIILLCKVLNTNRTIWISNLQDMTLTCVTFIGKDRVGRVDDGHNYEHLAHLEVNSITNKNSYRHWLNLSFSNYD